MRIKPRFVGYRSGPCSRTLYSERVGHKFNLKHMINQSLDIICGTNYYISYLWMLVLMFPVISGVNLDSRWVTTPESHKNVFEQTNTTFIWQFNPQPYDIAEVTVIHAPPNLHYEYSVVSEDVEIRGPPQTLRVYYHHFVWRVNVTYHSNTIKLTIANSSITDRGEIFVQVNYPGQVPLTSSTFLEVYRRPVWQMQPDQRAVGIFGEDLPFSLALRKVDFGPPLNRAVVHFVASSPAKESLENGTMIITPPGVYGGLEIRCQPFIFHRYLRYIGDVDLFELRFLITNFSSENVGLYKVTVFYSIMNYSLEHTTEVTQSDSPKCININRTIATTTRTVNSSHEDVMLLHETRATWCSRTVAIMAVVISVLAFILLLIISMKLYSCGKQTRTTPQSESPTRLISTDPLREYAMEYR